MHHGVEGMFGKQALEQLAVTDIAVDELYVRWDRVRGFAPVGALPRWVVVVVEVVEANHVVAALGETGCRMAADESGSAGDQYTSHERDVACPEVVQGGFLFEIKQASQAGARFEGVARGLNRRYEAACMFEVPS